MRYIEFGKDKEKVSELIIGLMRISEMTTEAVAELIHTGLKKGLISWILRTFMEAESQKKL